MLFYWRKMTYLHYWHAENLDRLTAELKPLTVIEFESMKEFAQILE